MTIVRDEWQERVDAACSTADPNAVHRAAVALYVQRFDRIMVAADPFAPTVPAPLDLAALTPPAPDSSIFAPPENEPCVCYTRPRSRADVGAGSGEPCGCFRTGARDTPDGPRAVTVPCTAEDAARDGKGAAPMRGRFDAHAAGIADLTTEERADLDPFAMATADRVRGALDVEAARARRDAAMLTAGRPTASAPPPLAARTDAAHDPLDIDAARARRDAAYANAWKGGSQ